MKGVKFNFVIDGWWDYVEFFKGRIFLEFLCGSWEVLREFVGIELNNLKIRLWWVCWFFNDGGGWGGGMLNGGEFFDGVNGDCEWGNLVMCDEVEGRFWKSW